MKMSGKQLTFLLTLFLPFLEAFKAAILKEAVRQNANSGGKVEKKEIRACRAEKHKKRTCK